jgi:septal ring factor EnvC (AmiA/AmiB activator)
MLPTMAVLLVLVAFAGILSKIAISRFIERLEVELFELIEEQRQTFRQLKQAKSDLKSAGRRLEMAQQECHELQTALDRALAQLNALTEAAERRQEQTRNRRAF